MHKKTVACYRVGTSRSKDIHTIQGVPQGDPLSPIIFNLVINPLLDTLDRECQGNDICHKLVCGDAETNSLFMYADDFVCVCESKEALQRAVNICQKCVNFFNLKANVKKSAVMRFFRKCVKKRKRQATLKSEVFNWGEKGPELPNVTKYKYLGMKLDTDLNWIEHFKKANEKFWLAMNKCKTTFEEPFWMCKRN